MRPYWDELEIPSLFELLRDATLGHFDPAGATQWARYHVPDTFKIAVVYLISIFAIQHQMRKREAYKLRGALIVWNIFQCIVSIFIFISTFPEAMSSLYAHGIRHVNCDTSFYNGYASLGHFAFAISKIIDVVDTYFLVLRKRPLTFLHYYHHAMVIFVTIYYYGYHFPTARPLVIANAFVHIWMYGYYAARVLQLKVPGRIARSITSLQIVQFYFGFLSGLFGTLDFLFDTECHEVVPAIGVIGWTLDISFLVLFHQFYNDSYVESGGKAKYRDSFKGKDEQRPQANGSKLSDILEGPHFD